MKRSASRNFRIKLTARVQVITKTSAEHKNQPPTPKLRGRLVHLNETEAKQGHLYLYAIRTYLHFFFHNVALFQCPY